MFFSTMSTNKNTQNMGAQAPVKRPVFSTTTQIQETRIRVVTNAPQETQQQGQTIRRVRAD